MESSRLLEQLNLLSRRVPHQKLSKYAAVLLILYLAYFVSTMIWRLVPVQQNQGKVTGPVIVSKSSNTGSGLNLKDFLALNLFGEEGKVEVEKPKPKPTQTAPKTRLNVKLTGLVADSSNPESSTSVAIIESSGGQSTYGINEKIKGTSASVYQILIDRVILLVSGRYETLMLDGIEYSTTVPGANNKVKPATAQVRQTVSKPGLTLTGAVNGNKKKAQLDKRKDVELSQSLRAQRQQLFDDPKKLLDVIRIRPYREKGELKGYRLSPGKDAKLFKQVGLKRNDLAVSINGYDLTNMQQALSVMAELKTMTEATITIVRQDESIDIILAL